MIRSDRVPAANSRYVTVGDRRIHYLEAGVGGAGGTDAPASREGDRPPVVLLHGSGIDDAALSWKHAIEHLATERGRRVYALDWPGYGESDDPEATPTTAYYVGLLSDFLDAIGIDRAALVGISMGGGAALGVALDRPELVERLALIDSYGLRDAVPGGVGSYLLANTPFANLFGRQFAAATSGATRLAVGEFVHDPASLSDDFVAEVNERLRRSGAGDAFFAFMRGEFRADGVRTDYSDRLDELSMPTLLLHGADDSLVPPEWSEAAAAEIPDARLELIEHCGHWPPRERPERFNELLSEFLDG
ncbi:Pimeloyl-ACP methyl ester carboxylesterase [Natronoarchaeum philippinense]|uniref:Pimeloyl-ACP methyl ester carboxylesterase n=1 Tax=Natronoarchaeum philippinense TaxID=558529 RepID=A0A285NBC0_NATPI|nr:alpha/beta fold hydrolase [Natronoarchaeum philippinense]SNZ06237.1 Pimeloyl-ACP methyl ester carboxylesterase [Natronoarchaeum philippinense]